jgi:hypothetical protein
MRDHKNTIAASTRIPAGSFEVSIQDLQNQVRSNRVQVGPNGLRQANGPNDWSATKVPKGTFHS